MRASVFQIGADGRHAVLVVSPRVVLSSSARPQMLGKTELRPRRFGEWTGNPTHSLPLSVASHSSGMIVLWCTVHISSPCPHTFRYSLHNPHRAIVPLFATVNRYNPASSITDISAFGPAWRPPGIPNTRTFSFVLLCVCQSSSPPFAYCCRVAEELLTVHQAFPSTP